MRRCSATLAGRLQRILHSSTLGTSCAVAVLVLSACNPQAPKSSTGATGSPSTVPTQPALHITGKGTATQPVRIVRQIHNRIEYELLASSFESRGSQGRTRAVFQNATVTFHGTDGSTMIARAPQAVADETANTLTLIGGVVAHSGSGVVLQCDTLEYDHTTQMLHGNGNVTIVEPNGFKGTGSSFDSDISLTHMTMR